MKTKELRATIETYKDWELSHIRDLYSGVDEDGSVSTKFTLCDEELKRRRVARAEGTYVDKTVSPSTSVTIRLNRQIQTNVN